MNVIIFGVGVMFGTGTFLKIIFGVAFVNGALFLLLFEFVFCCFDVNVGVGVFGGVMGVCGFMFLFV